MSLELIGGHGQWPKAIPVHKLHVSLTVNGHFKIECFKGEALWASSLWKSSTKARDVIKQSGFRPKKRMKWPMPSNIREHVVINIEEPAAWFWREE